MVTVEPKTTIVEERIKTAVVVRPFLAKELETYEELCLDVVSNPSFLTKEMQRGDSIVLTDVMGKKPEQSVAVDHVFWQHEAKTARKDGTFIKGCDAQQIYKTLGDPVVDRALEGINSAIIAYGGTNAGKTFQMLGVGSENSGIVKGVMQDLFQRLEKRTSNTEAILFDAGKQQGLEEFTVKVQAVENHMEQVQDLFLSKSSKQPLQVRQIDDQFFVQGAQWKTAKNFTTFKRLIDQASSNRITGMTKMNPFSSKASTFITVKIERDRIENSKNQQKSLPSATILFVDLVGERNMDKTQPQTVSAKSQEISCNEQVYKFENILEKLYEKQNKPKKAKTLVPYRQSKTNMLLRQAVGGNFATTILLCLRPGSNSYGLTSQNLETIEEAGKILNHIQIVEDLSKSLSGLSSKLDQLSPKGKRLTPKIKVSDPPVEQEELPSQNQQEAKAESKLEEIKGGEPNDNQEQEFQENKETPKQDKPVNEEREVSSDDSEGVELPGVTTLNVPQSNIQASKYKKHSLVDIGKADVLKNFVSSTLFSRIDLVQFVKILGELETQQGEYNFQEDVENLQKMMPPEILKSLSQASLQILSSALFTSAEGQLCRTNLLIFAILSCQSDFESQVRVFLDVVEKMALKGSEKEPVNSRIEANQFEAATSKLLANASHGLIDSLVEIGYSDKLYSQSQMNRLETTASQVCTQLTKEIFNLEQALSRQMLTDKLKEHRWIMSHESIREKIFEEAGVSMLHINQEEAMKELQALEQQADQLLNMAEKDEMQKKIKEEAVLSFLHRNTDEFDKVKNEIEKPQLFQQKDKFTRKYGLIFCNEHYDKTRLMADLPAVRDDQKTMKNVVQMMDIPKDNIFEFHDTSHEQIESLFVELKMTLLAQTKKLSKKTGIGGSNLIGGIPWDRLRGIEGIANAVTEGTIKVPLEQAESDKLKSLVEAQAKIGSGESLKGKLSDSTAICGVKWKRLKETQKIEGSETDHIQVSIGLKFNKLFQISLSCQEKVLLERYLQAESHCKDFLDQKDPQIPQEEIFILAYFAGHGCSDHKQYFLLNEEEVDKIFWPVEERLRQLAVMGGQSTKVVAVYDICREPYEPLREKVREELEKHACKSITIKESKPEETDDLEEGALDEESKSVVKLSRGTDGGEAFQVQNYFSIHGTIPGGLVDAKSNLALEFQQQLILKSMNLRREVEFPDDFSDFRGKDSKTVVTNNTQRFSLKFGDKTSFDQATEKLYKEFSKKTTDKNSSSTLSYFDILTGYLAQMLELEKPIAWSPINYCRLEKIDSVQGAQSQVIGHSGGFGLKKLKTIRKMQTQNEVDKWTTCVFGECGQGKSTALSAMAKIFAEEFDGAKDDLACQFKSGKAFEAVTTCVKVARTGNMTLIDTPGFNDVDVRKSDKNIMIELVNAIRLILTDSNQGISSFTQCIMPDESDRIRESSIKGMNNILLVLQSFDPSIDLQNHPRMVIVFNNVSCQYTKETQEEVERQKSERINQYRLALKTVAIRFYMTDVSDQTVIGQRVWKDIKSEVCLSEEHKKEEWYKNLPKDKQELICTLRELQLQIGESQPLQQQQNPKTASFISERIDALFPDSNFYFYKVYSSDDQRCEQEQDQLRQLIEDNIRSERFFIKSGLLEPVHLQEEERKLLVDGMQASITKIVSELIKSQELQHAITGMHSHDLMQRLDDTMEFKQRFDCLTHEKPWILQKCSLHGMILAKECISRVRDEAIEHCQKELADMIETQKQMLAQANDSINCYKKLFNNSGADQKPEALQNEEQQPETSSRRQVDSQDDSQHSDADESQEDQAELQEAQDEPLNPTSLQAQLLEQAKIIEDLKEENRLLRQEKEESEKQNKKMKVLKNQELDVLTSLQEKIEESMKFLEQNTGK